MSSNYIINYNCIVNKKKKLHNYLYKSFDKKKNNIEDYLNNISYLNNIYYLNNKVCINNTLNCLYNNKILSKKLIEIIYNYDDYKKKNHKYYINYVNSDNCDYFIFDDSKYNTIKIIKEQIESNILIIDFINGKK